MTFPASILSCFSSRPTDDSTLIPLMSGGDKCGRTGESADGLRWKSSDPCLLNNCIITKNMKKRTIMCAMILAAVSFLVVLVLGVTSSSSANDDSTRLKLLHVIIRHGERTPADTYPNDPYINATFHPFGWGQLTNTGKLALYDTGRFLRTRYAHFLGDMYTPDVYYTEATDVDRTKASVQMVNAGLWPPPESQRWGPLLWQPVPVHATPLDQDSLLLVRRPCAQYHLELAKVMERDEIRKKFDQNRQLFDNLTAITGKPVNNFDDVQDLYSTLRAEESFNLSLPEWTHSYYPTKLLPPTIFSYVLNAYTDKLRRLKGGVLLKKLIADWRTASAGNGKQRALLYGGHDSTVANVLSALGVWDPQMLEYGVMVLFELRTDSITNIDGVKIFLRNSTAAPPHPLTIPGCAPFCPLDTLIRLTEPVVPKNWEEECQSDDPSFSPPPPGGP